MLLSDTNHYFTSDADSGHESFHVKRPSTVDPSQFFARPNNDIDMGDSDSAGDSPKHSYLDSNGYIQSRSHSADPPMNPRSYGYQHYLDADPMQTSMPSLSPIHLGPGGIEHSESSTPASPYPSTPQSVVQPSGFHFPAHGPLLTSQHFSPDPALPYQNTRSSRHKPQRSLSAGQLPRPSQQFVTSAQLTRHGSLHVTPLPIQDCEPAQIPVKGTAVGAGAFVYKLYNMLLDIEYQRLIAFTASGTTFIVSNATEFSKIVLPKHFKHNNFSSFVRQLNMYGFHKVNKTPRGQKGSIESQAWEFSHPKFVRGGVELLDSIKRKATEDTSTNDPHVRMASVPALSQPATPATPFTPQQPRTSSSSHFAPPASAQHEHPPQNSSRLASQPAAQSQPQTPSIALPDYLHMLHQHQSDLGMHINRLEETCSSLYQSVVEGNRRQDTLVHIVSQLFESLQQSNTTKPPFEFPMHLFQSHQQQTASYPLFDQQQDFSQQSSMLQQQQHPRFATSPATLSHPEHLAGLGVQMDGMPDNGV